MSESIKELRRICQKDKTHELSKPGLGAWMERNIYRKTSIYITKIFIKLGISANQATLLSFIAGLLGGALLIFSSPLAWVFGGLFILVYELIDRTDGELARYRKTSSARGEYWDGIVGAYLWTYIFICVSLGVYNTFHNVWALVLGFATVLGYHMLDWIEIVLQSNSNKEEMQNEEEELNATVGPDINNGVIRLAYSILSFATVAVKTIIPLVALADIFISSFTVGNTELDIRHIYLIILTIITVLAATGRTFSAVFDIPDHHV